MGLLQRAVAAIEEDPDATYETFLFTFGFIPARYTIPLAQQGLEWLWTPVTYSFLHGGVEHILFNGLWLMAFGAPVARRLEHQVFHRIERQAQHRRHLLQGVTGAVGAAVDLHGPGLVEHGRADHANIDAML